MGMCTGDIAFIIGKVRTKPVHYEPVAPLPSHYATFVKAPESDALFDAQVVFATSRTVIVVGLPFGAITVYPNVAPQEVIDNLDCTVPTTELSYVGRAQEALRFAAKHLSSALAETGSVSSERGHTSR